MSFRYNLNDAALLEKDSFAGYFQRGPIERGSRFLSDGSVWHRLDRNEVKRAEIVYENRTDLTDDSGDFKVRLPSGGVHSVDHARIAHLSIPNSAYNVNDWNNQIKVTESGGPVATVTLTNGLYDAEALGDHIAAALTADGTLARTYTASFSTDTFKITLTVDSGTFTVDQSGLSYPLAYVAGLTTTAALASTATVLEFPNVVAVTPASVKLQIVELGYTVSVPFDSTIGAYAASSAQYRGQFELFLGREVSVEDVTVRVLDPQNNVLYLQGAPVFVQLELWWTGQQ